MSDPIQPEETLRTYQQRLEAERQLVFFKNGMIELTKQELVEYGHRARLDNLEIMKLIERQLVNKSLKK